MVGSVRFVGNRATGRKVAFMLSIPVSGLLWLLLSEVWRMVGLDGGAATVTIATLCLLLVVVIFLQRSDLRQLGARPSRLQRVVEAMAGGNLDLDMTTGYPATGVYAALQKLQLELRRKMAEEQVAIVEGARIQQALNTVTATVLVTDAAGDIVYINRVGTEFFREAAADIRKDLPGFNADNLHGKCISLFFRKSSQQRVLLADLRREYRTEVILGGRTFAVIANPIFGEYSERLGMVMEWVDRSAEREVEEEVQRVVDNVLAGDLGQRVALENKTGVSETLSIGVNDVVGLADKVITDVILALGALTSSSDEIIRSNTDLRRWADEQKAGRRQTATMISDMCTIVSRSSASAADVAELSTVARQQADAGVAIVGQALRSMHEIRSSSKEAANIIDIVDDIATQINVLAFNTSLEVALTGDKESVFAVVADEMRCLAARSAASAKQIKALVEESVAKVGSGIQLVSDSGESLVEIANNVKKITDVIGDIAGACKEQVSDIDGVSKVISLANNQSCKKTLPVNQAVAATTSLRSHLDELKHLVRFFTKNGNMAVKAAAPHTANANAEATSADRHRKSFFFKRKSPHLTLLTFPDVAVIDD